VFYVKYQKSGQTKKRRNKMVVKIRPIVVARMMREDGKLFLCEFTHDNGKKFYRMAGGGIEVGETAAEALKREFKEEFGVNIIVGGRVAVVENLFIGDDGAQGHEIVFIFDAKFADAADYQKTMLCNVEGDEQHKNDCGVWKMVPYKSPNDFYWE
jgi:ADP-ribose pyrophosphatase YjhB (NUDIX family)